MMSSTMPAKTRAGFVAHYAAITARLSAAPAPSTHFAPQKANLVFDPKPRPSPRLVVRRMSCAHERAYLLHRLQMLEEERRLSFDEILSAVSAASKYTRIDIGSPRRSGGVLLPRHVLAYLSRRLTPLSLPAIGNLIGGRGHATIKHSIAWVETHRRSPDVAELIALVCYELKVSEP